MPSNVTQRGERFGARLQVSGVDIWLGTFGSREEAEDAVRRAKGGWRPEARTVAEWAEVVWDLYPGRRTAETTAHYRAMCAPFVRVCGSRALADVDALLCQGWASRWPGHVPYLRRMFGKAVKAGVIASNPWADVEVVVQGEPRVPPTQEQLEAILVACVRRGGWWEEFARLVKVAALTGCRLSGLAGLCVVDVDLRRRRMVVTEKGSKTREVAILDAAVEALELQTWERVGRVWSSPQGRPLTRKRVSERWREVADEAGFAGSFHSLRHFAATWLQGLGADDRDIAVQLGHTDERGQPYTELIERTYGHVSPDLALARLDALASGVAAREAPIQVQEGSHGVDGVVGAHRVG